MSPNSKLIVYGTVSSQPVRAVIWPCLIKGIEIALAAPADITGYMQSPDYMKLNPMGKIPTIDDNGFILYEMPAILGYLCDTHHWNDLYPVDLVVRAQINQYLYTHQTLTRIATRKLMGPHVAAPFGGAGDEEGAVDPTEREMINTALKMPDMLAGGQRMVGRVVDVINSRYLGSDAPFLFNQPGPTIVDIACYQELSQLQPEWAGLFDYSPYPKVSNWLSRMADMPFHDSIHAYNRKLGDILKTPVTVERYLSACAAGEQALAEAGVEIMRVK